MKHLDLFSGIGGFALAVDEVWPGAEHIFCEVDPYCQALLKKRFEGSVIYGNIRYLERRGFITNAYFGGQAITRISPTRYQQCDRDLKVHLLTGGFPCQPFSQAGKRRGTEDNRFLWPEMLRVIREFKPTWVIAENVRGLLTIGEGLVFEQVCLDLEGEGYEVQPLVIPAVSKNAPHRRDRVWFVANRRCERQTEQELETTGSEQRDSNAPDTESIRGRGRTGQECGVQEREFQPGEQERCAVRGESKRCSGEWDKNWLEVATELCRVDDGISAEVDGLKLSKSKHRVERLKALGNAIVPQVAVEIMKAIKAPAR